MRRKCLTVCGKCTDCKEKTEFCDGYNGFWQESIFGTHQEPQYHSVPRRSWQHYGISKERYRKLTEYIQSGRYASVAHQAAHTANETIASLPSRERGLKLLMSVLVICLMVVAPLAGAWIEI